MAKESGGWSLRRDARTGNYTVRFTNREGRRVHRSTGTSDREAAQREAGRIYTEVVSGRQRARVAPGKLEELSAEWLVDHAAGRSEETIAEYERYVAVLFLPFFRTLAGLTDASCADYTRTRLRQVSVSTVKKELSALRQLAKWLHEKGYIEEKLRVDPPPRRALGRPDTVRKQVRVDLSREQVLAIIKRLPEWSRQNRTGAPPIPVRAFAVVMAETGLRKGSLYRLRAPEHYHRGAAVLALTPDVDKARAGRPLPLSARARAALDTVCPDVGLIFGRIEVRWQLAEASKHIGLPEHLAGRVSYHDFRHAFITHLADANAPGPALQYLAGHKHFATTARYIHARAEAAEDALRLLDTKPGRTPKGTPRAKAKKKAPPKRSQKANDFR